MQVFWIREVFSLLVCIDSVPDQSMWVERFFQDREAVELQRWSYKSIWAGKGNHCHSTHIHQSSLCVAWRQDGFQQCNKLDTLSQTPLNCCIKPSWHSQQCYWSENQASCPNHSRDAIQNNNVLVIVIMLKELILDWSEILSQEWRMNDLSWGRGKCKHWLCSVKK